MLTPVVLLASWHERRGGAAQRRSGYFALVLLLEAMMIGVFAATDVFLFYVFFEAMLDPDVLPHRALRRAAALATRR